MLKELSRENGEPGAPRGGRRTTWFAASRSLSAGRARSSASTAPPSATQPVIPEYEAKLVSAMNKIADRHPRWGYRTATKLLRDEGWAVNKKRDRAALAPRGPSPAAGEGQGLRPEGPRNVARTARSSGPALRPNDIWTYDFMSARVRRGGPIRILNVLDEFTRLSLGSKVSRSIGAQDVVAHLELLFETSRSTSCDPLGQRQGVHRRNRHRVV